MRILYNLLLLIGLILVGPVLVVKVLVTPKYGGRIFKRLGLGAWTGPALAEQGRPRIWVHALSLGEVASCRGLVRNLRAARPDCLVIFSSATAAGEAFARRELAEFVDAFVPFPLDLPCVVRRALKRVRPDLFILVETDFWPNFLYALRGRRVPSLLVNGRISAGSWQRYRRARWLFAPLFQTFNYLAMQGNHDVEKMLELGVAPDRVGALGNLKYETSGSGDRLPLTAAELGIPASRLVVVAGSTHAGEEALCFEAFQRLRRHFPTLFLVVAPRQVERGVAVAELAMAQGLAAFRRSGPGRPDGEVLVLDTLGELARVYGLAAIAFVGGSLVPERGHNPLEPARFGIPVLYGPSMEDFADISSDLLAAGAARQVRDGDELFAGLRDWLEDPRAAEQAGAQAAMVVRRQQGVTQRHLSMINQLLAGGH